GTIPLVDAPTDVTMCDSYTLPALTNGTYYTGAGGTGSMLNAGDLITSTQTIYVYAETGTTPNCFAENSFDVTINPMPTIVPPTPFVVCDDTVIDGVTEMDLTVKDNEISGGNTNYIVTYYNSLTAAQAGMPEVMPSSSAYIGTDGEVVYVRVEDSNTGCFDTTTLTLNVLTGPPVATPTPLYDCDVDNDNLGTFDLSPVRDDILATDPTLIVTFHLTLQNALDDVNPQGDSLSNVAGQIIYVRVEFGTGLDCATIVELQLIVEPAPEIPDNISPYVICDDDLDGMATFNLTTMDATIYGTQNPADFVLTYHESLADAEAIPGVNPIIEPDLSNYVSGNTTIYVRLEGLNGCINVGQFDLIVNPIPQIPAEAQDGIYEICDDSSDNDGYAVFDLTTQNDGLTGGDATFDVNYYETMADIPNNPISDYTAYNNVSIGGLPHNPQTIFVTVTETASGSSCYSVTSLTLIVNTLPTPNDVLPDLTVCDDNNPGDLQEEFDLTQNEGLMLNDFDEMVTYHETLDDAESGDNAINNATAYTNISSPQTIYVRVTNTGDPNDASDDGTGCYAIVTFDLIVDPLPVFNIDDFYTICINLNGTEVIGNPTIDTELSSSLYTFEWIEDGDPSTILSTDSFFMPTVEGNYTVTVTDINSGCSSSDSTVVQLSSPPMVTATVATEAFANNHIIVVTATGDGAALFEFSIDNGPWVSNEPNSNTYTFSNVPFGEHVIQARDINGCGIASDMVLVMDYPLFFTPNNDGYNDTWQIFGIENQFDAKIFIYDRYGKLLKQLSPTGPGWDGTYNGELLPSSDYWFTIDYRELGESDGAQKQFRAHFSLKR
ncbi:T9SS type B sorting domain-containing protein, partial [Formosa maritima]|uniref:T9SS type B sorting domain-containing protein n=1 Tax=Formosa maritima TaxID=2592046 RepID=UPI001F241C8C